LEGEAIQERTTVHSGDYYIYPRITEDYRLGEIVRNKKSGDFVVIVTPHCHLIKQPGQEKPRAEYIVVVETSTASKILEGKAPEKRKKLLRHLISMGGHEEVGRPEGRYCFLPGFLAIPDLYCDLLRISHLTFSELRDDYDRIAVLDAPYAEALQAQLTRFFLSIGLPVLAEEHFAHLQTA
jgi:hypothetical protein